MPAVSTGSSGTETSWTLTISDYVLLALLFSTLYMPMATSVYYARRDLPSIRYRNPVQMTICGVTATLYCWVKIVFELLNTTVSCTVYEYLVSILFHFTTFSVFLSEISLSATFYLTEILVITHESGHTPQNDRKSRLLHNFLKPSTTFRIWLVGHITWSAPSLAFVASFTSDLSNTTLRECPENILKAADTVSAVQLGLILVLGAAVTNFMSIRIDNFGLRSTYIYAHRLWLTFYLLFVVLAFFHDLWWLKEYAIHSALMVLAIQSIVWINIVRPLYLSLKDRMHQHNERLKGSEKLLEAFLLTQTGYEAFSAFCRQQCVIDKLIVWKATVKEDNSDENTPQRLYRRHLRKDAPLPLLSMSNHLKDMYHGLFEANLKYHVDVNDQDLERVWFVPLRDELLKVLVREVLPQFQLDPLGVDWSAFLHVHQATQALDLVLSQDDDKPEEVEKVLAPKPRTSLKTNHIKVPQLATIFDTESPR